MTEYEYIIKCIKKLREYHIGAISINQDMFLVSCVYLRELLNYDSDQSLADEYRISPIFAYKEELHKIKEGIRLQKYQNPIDLYENNLKNAVDEYNYYIRKLKKNKKLAIDEEITKIISDYNNNSEKLKECKSKFESALKRKIELEEIIAKMEIEILDEKTVELQTIKIKRKNKQVKKEKDE